MGKDVAKQLREQQMVMRGHRETSMNLIDTSPQLRRSVDFVLVHCQLVLTLWERLVLELEFYWLLRSSTSTLKFSLKNKVKWVAWELCCSKRLVKTMPVYNCGAITNICS